MKLKRIGTLLLSFMMMSSVLFSCGDSAKGNDTSGDTSSDTSMQEEAETELSHELPSDLNYNAPFRVLFSGGNYMGDNLDKFDSTNLDVLQQATYDRLLMVEEKLGVEFDFVVAPGNIDGIAAAARQTVSSGSDDYEFIVGCALYLAPTIYEGLYLPVDELPYVNLDKPWWNKDYIESVSLSTDENHILFGSINYNSVQRSVCTAFNVDLLEQFKGLSPDDMYGMVLDGKWTLDKFTELCKDVYKDNGNAYADKEDIFALIHSSFTAVDFLAFGAGLTFTERDDDGYPVISINNDRSVQLADKLLSIFTASSNVFNAGESVTAFELFGTGHTMFYVERFLALEKDVIRGSDVEYGIIPVPKLDETVDGYYTPIERLVQWGTVPITVSDPAMASAVLELMAYDGYMNVMPAYYDITLKLKYTRGDDLDMASQMLDMITLNSRTDFLVANSLGGLEQIFTKVVNSGTNTFASTYASLYPAAEAKLEEYIKFIEEE